MWNLKVQQSSEYYKQTNKKRRLTYIESKLVVTSGEKEEGRDNIEIEE